MHESVIRSLNEMNSNPLKISIVTPSFNQGTFLEKTIQSVLSQDYPNLEYIIIDGGSTDKSVEIIKKYAERLSYWVSEPDAGQSDAINKGFRKASGDICAWINSDDVYYPGVLTIIAASFEEHPSVDLLYGYHNDVNEKDEVIRKGMYFPFYKHAFKVGFAICQPTSFWKRKVWDICGPLDTNLHYCMDYDFYAKAIKVGFQVKSVPILICKFRYHETNKSTTSRAGFAYEGEMLLSTHFGERHQSFILGLVSKIELFLMLGTRKLLRLFLK